MRKLSQVCLMLLAIFSGPGFGAETPRDEDYHVVHDCRLSKPNSELSKVQIVSWVHSGQRQDLLLVSGPKGVVLKVDVEDLNDISFLAYFNEAEGVYFELDWPMFEQVGPGILQIGKWDDPLTKTYRLECVNTDWSEGL